MGTGWKDMASNGNNSNPRPDEKCWTLLHLQFEFKTISNDIDYGKLQGEKPGFKSVSDTC